MASPNPLSYGSFEIYHDDEDKVLGVGSYGKVCKAKYGQLPRAAKLLHETMFEVVSQASPLLPQHWMYCITSARKKGSGDLPGLFMKHWNASHMHIT